MLRAAARNILLLALVIGCQTAPPVRPTGPVNEESLQPGDRIQVQIDGSPDASGFYTVDIEGRLDVRQVGPLVVAGQAVRKVSAMISGKLGKRVTIFISDVETHAVMVYGLVKIDRQVPFKEGMTAMQAIRGAGGVLDSAGKVVIHIVRMEKGKALVIPDVLIEDIATGKAKDPPVLGADEIGVIEAPADDAL